MSEYSAYVVVATSLAAGITSWNAHDDLSRRVSRYTNAVRSIERLLWWWQSLDDIERASASNIALLVESGEAIISAERLAWITAFKKEQKAKSGASGEEEAACLQADVQADGRARDGRHGGSSPRLSLATRVVIY